jgi:hypothetical protein
VDASTADSNFYIYRVLSGCALTYIEAVADLSTALEHIKKLCADTGSDFVVTRRDKHDVIARVSNTSS